jgi:hypothetical protein
MKKMKNKIEGEHYQNTSKLVNQKICLVEKRSFDWKFEKKKCFRRNHLSNVSFDIASTEIC